MAASLDISDFRDTDVIFKDGDDMGFEVETLSDIKLEPDSGTAVEDTNVESADTNEAVDSDTNDVEYTVEEAVDAMGFGWFQIRVACIVGFNWMADAFEIMLVSVLSDKLRCEWNLYPWQQALITTFVFTGYFLGAPLWGLMGDKFGRRKTLALCSFYIFYFGFLSSFSPNLIWMLILRGLLGFSLGGTSQAVIICAEFLPSKSRGLCLTCLEAFWVIGICLEITLAMVVIPTLGWRYLLVFSSFPLVLFIALVKLNQTTEDEIAAAQSVLEATQFQPSTIGTDKSCDMPLELVVIAVVVEVDKAKVNGAWYSGRFLPESALYQQASGNWKGAMATLEEISRINKKPLPPGKLQRKIELKPKGSIRELFSTKLMAITSVLLINLWFCNAFLYYGNVLLSTELFSSGETCVSNSEQPEQECFSACTSLDVHGYANLLVTSLAEFPGILLTLIIIETLGRKLTMGVEMLVCAVFTFLLLICIGGITQKVFIFIVRALISGAFQALYVYTPEVFPTHVRSVGMGMCVSASRMGAILTPFVAQVLVKQSLKMTICVYGGFTVLASLVSFVLPVETKGRILK